MRCAPMSSRIPICRGRFKNAPIRHRSGSCRQMFSDVISRAVREPLLQFLAVASLLFFVNHLVHGPSPRALDDSVTISKGRVEQLAESYRLLAGRMPSRAELQALVEDFIDEEIDYREAIAMGLDADDTIVRRRMRQKLEFLAEDGDAREEPSHEELAAWLRSHAAEYR